MNDEFSFKKIYLSENTDIKNNRIIELFKNTLKRMNWEETGLLNDGPIESAGNQSSI